MSFRDEIVRRLDSIDVAQPRVHRAAAEDALADYLRTVGIAPVEAVWHERPRPAGASNVLRARHRRYEQLRRRFLPEQRPSEPGPAGTLAHLDEQAFWNGLTRRRHDPHLSWGDRPWRLARGACLLSRSLLVAARQAGSRDSRRERAWLALADAAAEGLFAFWVREGVALLVSRPRLRVEEGRLHAWDGGPALTWGDGTRQYFWRGLDVGERVGRRADRLELRDIRNRRNVEVRRVLIERYGWERYLHDSGAALVSRDAFGSLWRARAFEPGALVEVENSTPEPDGSRKRYFLRVPPEMRSPREAVAWTFGIERPDAYAPVAES
jgi:hypothetical protein